MESFLAAPRFPGLSSAELRLLQSECQGTVYDRGAPGFSQQTRLWNGNLVCSAKAVCCPIDAQDVSRIILFCNKHNLSFSVKAGGYAVAGWAVAGDIVIDLCLIDVIDIEAPLPLSPANNVGSPSSATSSTTAETDPPTPQSSGPKRKEWTPLTEMPSVRPQVKPDKGKGRMAMDMDGFLPNNFPPHMLPRADSSVGVGGKRARSSTPDDASRASFNSFSPDSPFKLPSSFDGSDDNRVSVASLVKRRRAERGTVEAMVYDAASREVASFLRGAPLDADPRYPSRSQPEVSAAPPSSITNGAEKTALGCGPGLADSPSNGESKEERHVSSGSRDPFDYMGNGPSHSKVDGDDTSPHSSPSSVRSIPRSEMLSNMTDSGTTSNPAPDPFGMLLNGPVGTQPTVLAPPALLSRRPPPLPAGFSPSTRAVPVVGTAPVGFATGSEDSMNFSTTFPSMIAGVLDYTNGSASDNRDGNGDSSNDGPARKRNDPLKSGFNGDTTNGAPLPRHPKTGKIPIDPSTLDMLAPSSRGRLEATSTALPDGDLSLPDSTTFINTVLEHGIDAVENFPYTEEKENGKSDDADPFGYLSMPAGPIMPGSPGLHVHGDGVFEQRPTMPMRMSTTTALASDLDNMLGPISNPAAESNSNGFTATGSNRSRAPQPGEDMGGVSGGLPPAPVHPHAYVTFGAGMQQREVDLFTTAHPLPARSMHTQVGGPADTTVPYYVPFAAHPVGSSVMMLGGFGFISRLHGLSLDNVVEVEMVLADGRIVIVSETENTDLWFALRGAGPAFGIATRYKARAYPVPVVFAGNLIYRFHRATAPSLLKHYRDCVKGAPRELYANVLLTAGPADQDSLVVIQICYSGPRSKGLEFLHALSSWEGEPCLLNEVGEKSYLAQQDSVAQVLRGQKGRKWFIRSTLISSLPDEVIHNTVNQFANTPIGCTWLFELGGGALVDTEDSCIPPEQREAAFNCAALHQWDIHVDDPRCVSSAEKWIHETLSSVSTGAPFTCFLGRHEPYKRVIACFGSNWDRLRELKRKYDPRGLFKHNFWPGHDEVTLETLAEREPASP